MFHWKTNILLPLLMLLAFANCATAQDPAVVAPDYYTVLLENEHIRVMEFTLPPGEADGMHSHPFAFTYFIDGGEVELTAPDGSTRTATLKSGFTFWQKPTTHMVKNIGDTTIRVAAFEIRSNAGNGIELQHQPEIVAPATNRLLLDNEHIRAVETTIPPGKGGKLHDHMHMAVYTFTAAKLRIVDAKGNAREVDVPAGSAMWMEPITHRVTNIGSEPCHLLHVEVK